MTTLSRYVLKEHGWPFALGFVLILFILLIDVVLQTMDQVLSKGLTLLAALQLLLFNLAWIVALAVPMAVLIAVLMAFARLAADGEIIAAKACGVSFWLLLRPVVVAAFLLSLLMVLFNDQILPDWESPSPHPVVELATDESGLGAAGKGRGLHTRLGRLSPTDPPD